MVIDWIKQIVRKKLSERHDFVLYLKHAYVLLAIKYKNKKIIPHAFKGIFSGTIILLHVVLILKSRAPYIELLNLKLIPKELFHVFMIPLINLVSWHDHVLLFGLMQLRSSVSLLIFSLDSTENLTDISTFGTHLKSK